MKAERYKASLLMNSFKEYYLSYHQAATRVDWELCCGVIAFLAACVKVVVHVCVRAYIHVCEYVCAHVCVFFSELPGVLVAHRAILTHFAIQDWSTGVIRPLHPHSQSTLGREMEMLI